MGSEVSTVTHAAGTAVTGVAVVATFGQVDAVNKACKDSAKACGRSAENTTVRHVGEAAVKGSAAVVGGVAVAVTLGQCDKLNNAVKECAEEAGTSSLIGLNKLGSNLKPANWVDDFAAASYNKFTRDLPSQDIRAWLVKSAKDCYDHPPTFTAHGGGRICEILHAVVYDHKDGKKCLAIRGTQAPATYMQDFGGFLGSENLVFEGLIREASEWARKARVDYVTGHSLGGYLAEAVASRLGLDGASFCGPGGRGPTGVFRDNWSTSTCFEVHLHDSDLVSLIAYHQHIAHPKWHRYNAAVPHFIEHMARSVEGQCW